MRICALAIVDQATGGTFTGQNVTLSAGKRDDNGVITQEGNLSLVGVDVVARGDATLNATGNVNIVSAQESTTLSADRSQTRRGLFTMGGGLNTHSNRGDTATQETTTQRGSTITAGGKIDVNAGDSATIYASQLTAQEAVQITGKDVNIISGVDTVSSSYGTRNSSDGISSLIHRTGTGFGNEASTDSSVSMSTLAPTSVTGKSVTLTATDGDITLGAAKIKSTGTQEDAEHGVTLNAEKGAVNLLVVKTACPRKA